jgi:hypothetical protein
MNGVLLKVVNRVFAKKLAKGLLDYTGKGFN